MAVESPQAPRAESLLSKGIGTRGQYSKQQIEKLAQEISDLTGYDLVTVRHFLKNKAFQSGDLKSLNIIRSLISKQYETKETQAPEQTKLANPTGDKDLQSQQLFNVKNQLQQQRTQLFEAAKNPAATQSKFEKTELQQFLPLLTSNVTSPRQFASMLVNNKAAFILLRANPTALQFLTTMGNRNLYYNPVFFSQVAAFITNIMKMKQTRNDRTEEDEQTEFNSNQEELLAQTDHDNALVKNIREAINNMPVSRLKDFLLEAERFAEEEIANLWSISLKKEKQLEKILKNIPEDIKQAIGSNQPENSKTKGRKTK